MAHLSEIKTARLSSALILPPSSPLIDRPRISLTLDADPTPYIEIVLPHRELEKIGRYSDLSVRACFQRIKKDFPDILSRESVDEQIRNIPESFTNRTAIIRNIRALFRTQASNESLPYGSYIHLRVRGAVNGCESDEILTKRAGRSHYEFRDTPEVVQRAEEAVKELTVRYKDKRDKGVEMFFMRNERVWVFYRRTLKMSSSIKRSYFSLVSALKNREKATNCKAYEPRMGSDIAGNCRIWRTILAILKAFSLCPYSSSRGKFLSSITNLFSADSFSTSPEK